jgi:hypothetical protein
MKLYQTQPMKTLILGLIAGISCFCISSCTKEVPKELLQQNKQQQNQMSNQNMPDDSIHRNLMPGSDQNTNANTEGGDDLAETLTKEADDADANYEKSKSDSDKKLCIEKQMEAANYLMFQADLPPRKNTGPHSEDTEECFSLTRAITRLRQIKNKSRIFINQWVCRYPINGGCMGFFEQYSYIIVLAATLLIWFGMYFYTIELIDV